MEALTKDEWLAITRENSRLMTEQLLVGMREILNAQAVVVEEQPTEAERAKVKQDHQTAMRRMFACAAMQMYRVEPASNANAISIASEDALVNSCWRIADKMLKKAVQ